MIVVSSISKSFGDNLVLDDISFKLAAGELVGLAGPSGSGKSVLLKILGKVIPADRGSISYDENFTGVGFSFQEGALFDSMSVIENVAFALLSSSAFMKNESENSRADALEAAYEILSKVGLSKAILKNPAQLSGGMRRRVAIARALVAKPNLVLLDDPTGGLDPIAAGVIMDMITELHQLYSPTMLIVSHDIRRLLPKVSRLICLFKSKILCDLPSNAYPSAAPENVVRFLSTRYDFPSV